MSKIAVVLRVVVLSALVTMLSVCATTQTTEQLSATSDQLAATIKAASDALETERAAKTRTRRAEAIEYYLKTRTLTATSGAAITVDISPSDPLGSFSRFVCAGLRAFKREQSALSYTRSYSAGLKAVLDPGGDSASAQIARFRTLNDDAVVVPVKSGDNTKEKGVAKSVDCVSEVQNIMSSWQPEPTTSRYDEDVVATISAATAAYKAIEDLVTKGLTEWNNYSARQKFAEFAKANHQNFSQVMTIELSENRLADSWNRRQAVALLVPYATFKNIFGQPASNPIEVDADKVRELGFKTHNQLAEFDAMQRAPRPQDIRKALIAAEAALMAAANDDSLSMSTIKAHLSDLQDKFKSAKTAYELAEQASREFIDSWK